MLNITDVVAININDVARFMAIVDCLASLMTASVGRRVTYKELIA